MRNKILLFAGLAVLIVGAAIFALAQEHGDMRMKHGGPPPDMIEHISRELNLTDDQKNQVKALFDAQKSTEDVRRIKMDEIHKQLEAATANGQFDETTVRNLASQEAQLHADEMVDHIRLHSKIYGLLTAEQRTKADQMMKRHGGPGGPGGPGGFDHHGPPPPPPAAPAPSN
ncbi:MAG TPA: Spy/CpxP family protein refolding chaperone [Pyrinomonadaceae bacterium]|nr:Spy/CpxP family protein refolding chaperone [Pyrinomonadaceae bacterium]